MIEVINLKRNAAGRRKMFVDRLFPSAATQRQHIYIG